jgi:8-oxo-dGTP pyrophosphatase MutT (NUDIX family)
VSFDVDAFYAGLPRKRVAAGVLYRDGAGRVLLVEPAYKPSWEIPGGTVEDGEAPRTAAAREVREELGLDLPVWDLLVVDWVAADPPRPDGLKLLFDGGVLDARTTAAITLPAAELVSWRWCDRTALRALAEPRLAARVGVGLDVVLDGGGPGGRVVRYLENGAGLRP